MEQNQIKKVASSFDYKTRNNKVNDSNDFFKNDCITKQNPYIPANDQLVSITKSKNE